MKLSVFPFHNVILLLCAALVFSVHGSQLDLLYRSAIIYPACVSKKIHCSFRHLHDVCFGCNSFSYLYMLYFLLSVDIQHSSGAFQFKGWNTLLVFFSWWFRFLSHRVAHWKCTFLASEVWPLSTLVSCDLFQIILKPVITSVAFVVLHLISWLQVSMWADFIDVVYVVLMMNFCKPFRVMHLHWSKLICIDIAM